jgi:hypothetical protein
MMFIVRTGGELPNLTGVALKAQRRTPGMVPDAAGKTDYFCVAGEAAVATLPGDGHADGFEIVRLRDGWYADDSGGGIVIFGHGRFWEVRDTPFTVKEAAGPAETALSSRADPEQVNVRGAIFGV